GLGLPGQEVGRHGKVEVAVAVEVPRHQRPDRVVDSQVEDRAGREGAGAVAQEDVDQAPLRADGNVQVAVPVEVADHHRAGGVVGDGEGGAAVEGAVAVVQLDERISSDAGRHQVRFAAASEGAGRDGSGEHDARRDGRGGGKGDA